MHLVSSLRQRLINGHPLNYGAIKVVFIYFVFLQHEWLTPKKADPRPKSNLPAGGKTLNI
jgi:hypothetical protein